MGRRGRDPVLPRFCLHLPFGGFVAQLQVELSLDHACRLVVELASYPRQQDMGTLVTNTHTRRGKLSDPHLETGLTGTVELVPDGCTVGWEHI